MRLVSREARIELCQTRLLFSTVVLFLAKRNPAVNQSRLSRSAFWYTQDIYDCSRGAS